MDEQDVKASAAYQAYHAKVVDACVKLMGEKNRAFFDKQCDYLDEFAEQTDPAEVAEGQYQALT